tara:strand:- start:277 stop:522 length:246 start_codon:yes stop_codon:yes gene_type:complete
MIDDLFKTLGDVLSRTGVEDMDVDKLKVPYHKIWVLDDGYTWTACRPMGLYVTPEQLEILKSGEDADDLMDALLEEQHGGS